MRMHMRRHPIPDMSRFNAPSEPNEPYERVEMPVRRHTRTTSVLTRSQRIGTGRYVRACRLLLA
jgi:hypothetical protein